MDRSQLTAPLPALPVEGHPPANRGMPPAIPSHEGNGKPAADHDQVDLNVPHSPVKWVVVAGVVALVCLITLLVIGIMPRLTTNKQLAIDANAALNAPIPVNVVKAYRAPASVDVTLPGTLRPWQEVSIFARSTGYLKKFYVDISNQVKAGQLMADIQSPEIDQQLRAAEANLRLQKANAEKARTDLAFAETTYKRFESLKGSSGVTQQELDQYQAQYKSAVATLGSAEANVGVAQANVQQLTEMQSFEKVVAPFAGVVTGRAYDNGSLIIANPTTADQLPMFKLAENDILRAFVNVPQNHALSVQKGMKVTVTARERAGRDFIGTVLGTTNYLDPAARSLLTEIRIENPDYLLLPGMFVQAVFHVERDRPPLMIPGPALVINADGNQVAVIQNGRVHFKPVQIGVDYGNDVEIVTGLDGTEQILGNPGGKTVEGAEVTVAAEQDATPPDKAQQPPPKPENVAEAPK